MRDRRVGRLSQHPYRTWGRLSCRIDPQLHQWLSDHSVDKGTPIRELVETLLYAYQKQCVREGGQL